VVTWVRFKAGTSRIQVHSIITIPTLSMTYFINNVRTEVNNIMGQSDGQTYSFGKRNKLRTEK
jgi:hypothetical protein